MANPIINRLIKMADRPNTMPKGAKLVDVPVDAIEHGESAMPGGKLTFPDAQPLVEEYAKKDTPFPPIEVMADDSGVMVVDGSHRLEAARLRGDKTIPAYVMEGDLKYIPKASVVATGGILGALGLPQDATAADIVFAERPEVSEEGKQEVQQLILDTLMGFMAPQPLGDATMDAYNRNRVR